MRYLVGETTFSSSTLSNRKSSGISRKTGPGHVGGRDAERGRDVLAEAARVGHGDRPLGDRPHQLDVVHVLQAAHVLERPRRLPADDDHRRLGALRGRDAGDGVGQAGAGRDERDAGLPGDARPAVGGVRRGLLVPHVDDADALVDAPVVDRHDVTAAEREDELDALFGEGARDDLSTVKLCHSESPS